MDAATTAILTGYRNGTRYGIAMDQDGLLRAGVPGVALTWMDARVDGVPITARIGKPVEIQALWVNALHIASALDASWGTLRDRARGSFNAAFWNAKRGCLYDVVDVDHERGRVDPTLRPNQIFAAGGLPLPLLDGDRARQMVDVVERELWTPMGLRTLGPSEAGYAGRYQGDSTQRDRIYHQGAAWPWLAGAFVDAWLAVRGRSPEHQREAQRRFIQPLLDQRHAVGLGHLSELADGDAPHTSRGCPYQAWSLGELIYAESLVQ